MDWSCWAAAHALGVGTVLTHTCTWEAGTCPTWSRRQAHYKREVACVSLPPPSQLPLLHPRPLGAVPPRVPASFQRPADSRAMLTTGRRLEDSDLEKQRQLARSTAVAAGR